jgi:hypothetical protein
MYPFCAEPSVLSGDKSVFTSKKGTAAAIVSPTAAGLKPQASSSSAPTATSAASPLPASATPATAAQDDGARLTAAATDQKPSSAAPATSSSTSVIQHVVNAPISKAARYTEADRSSLVEFQRSAMQLLRNNAQLQHVLLKVQAHDTLRYTR